MKSTEDHRKYLRRILPPPIVLTILVLAGYVVQWLLPVRLIFDKWSVRLIIGLPILSVSAWFAIDALLLLNKNKTAITYIKPTTKLLIERSFRITRNPLYLSLFLVVVGIIVISNSLWYCFSILLLFLFFDQYLVPREEIYLEKIFGENYVKYKNSIRRWL